MVIRNISVHLWPINIHGNNHSGYTDRKQKKSVVIRNISVHLWPINIHGNIHGNIHETIHTNIHTHD